MQGWEKNNNKKVGHHARPRRASATAPLHTGADTCKTGSGAGKRAGAKSDPVRRRSNHANVGKCTTKPGNTTANQICTYKASCTKRTQPGCCFLFHLDHGQYKRNQVAPSTGTTHDCVCYMEKAPDTWHRQGTTHDCVCYMEKAPNTWHRQGTTHNCVCCGCLSAAIGRDGWRDCRIRSRPLRALVPHAYAQKHKSSSCSSASICAHALISLRRDPVGSTRTHCGKTHRRHPCLRRKWPMEEATAAVRSLEE